MCINICIITMMVFNSHYMPPRVTTLTIIFSSESNINTNYEKGVVAFKSTIKYINTEKNEVMYPILV